jgi:hypothetical protein
MSPPWRTSQTNCQTLHPLPPFLPQKRGEGGKKIPSFNKEMPIALFPAFLSYLTQSHKPTYPKKTKNTSHENCAKPNSIETTSTTVTTTTTTIAEAETRT